ncbi:uncharacterized protein TNCV_270171 [Trichonephila clavipes]|nr:uncharacterized protein TNCV_270171 [Trichonephila clavipes]
MMHPVVESCLPAEVLKAWIRHRLNREVPDLVLENLMTFLRYEVEGEEHRVLAETAFGISTNRAESHKQVLCDEPTATTLVVNTHAGKLSCIFCDRPYSSQDCQTRVTKTVIRLCVGDAALFALNLVTLQKYVTNQISEQVLELKEAVQEYLDDMENAENYRDRYIEKFSGEAKDFLAFWSQFQKIDNDKSITEEDKMQYLLQSVEPKSKAEREVLSFPATAKNYPKAIDQLKEIRP